nr:hypothetical protein GCM10020093_084940 [Planobispora longispora]
MRSEPSPSAPWASGTIPDATAAALPPDEPPEVRSRSHGLRVTPYTLSEKPARHSSGTLVIPTTTAPASRSRATTGWSSAAGVSGVAADPQRIASPRTGTLSLTAIGTPASGSSARSSRSCTAAASASASSARTLRNAPTLPSRPAIVRRCSSTTAGAVTFPVARLRRSRLRIFPPTTCTECGPAGTAGEVHYAAIGSQSGDASDAPCGEARSAGSGEVSPGARRTTGEETIFRDIAGGAGLPGRRTAVTWDFQVRRKWEA